jgi:tRNA(Leu) C34 or U34 (ribose-2'-O)-methylase TrmL
MKTWKHIPLFHFSSIEDLIEHLPLKCRLVAVELDTKTYLQDFKHPEQACYLLGAEDTGIPSSVLTQAHRVVRLPGEYSMNVACAGSIVCYDRVTRG